MEEQIVTKDELIKMFEDYTIIDSGKGWIMGDKEVQIVALHDVDPKFLQDVSNAKFYKLTIKGSN